jgi:hypothetical protein
MQVHYWQDLFPSSPFASEALPCSSPATPAEFICEAITLKACDELPYLFELRQGQHLEFEIKASRPIDIAVCEEDEYDRWVDSGFSPEHSVAVYREAEDVASHKLRFTAPMTGEFVVLLMNWSDVDADVAVEANDQPGTP